MPIQQLSVYAPSLGGAHKPRRSQQPGLFSGCLAALRAVCSAAALRKIYAQMAIQAYAVRSSSYFFHSTIDGGLLMTVAYRPRTQAAP